MSTFGDALVDIEKLQKEMDKCLKKTEDKFITDLFCFTTIYYLNILSHACLLDGIKNTHENRFNKYCNKYYSLSLREDLLLREDIWTEYIRLTNISGIFLLWNIFELYINSIYKNINNQSKKYIKEKIEEKYKEILKNKNIKSSEYNRMTEEFNCIRLTRNSLHQGGIYNNKKKRKYELEETVYFFEKGQPVKPIRITDIANVLWKHYKRINNFELKQKVEKLIENPR